MVSTEEREVRAVEKILSPEAPEAPWKVEEVMLFTGMSRRYILDLARAGLLPARKISRTWFFSPSKVAAFFGTK